MSFTTSQSRWRALTTRDATASGHFVYSVKSTGIYCRPNCPSRLARRANVDFYLTPADAETAGFLPCKRCKPETADREDPAERAVERAYDFITAAARNGNAEALTLQDLATHVGLTPRYFHKIFKDKTGITPKEYAKLKEKGSATAEQSDTLSVGEERDGVDMNITTWSELEPEISLSNYDTSIVPPCNLIPLSQNLDMCQDFQFTNWDNIVGAETCPFEFDTRNQHDQFAQAALESHYTVDTSTQTFPVNSETDTSLITDPTRTLFDLSSADSAIENTFFPVFELPEHPGGGREEV